MTKLSNVLAERNVTYGEFSVNAKLAQALKQVLRDDTNWNVKTGTTRQALDVICDKISRILSGDERYADNWIDIQGYAKLAEDRLAPVPVPETACVDPIAPQGLIADEQDAQWLPWAPGFVSSGKCYVVVRHDTEGYYQHHEVGGRIVFFTFFDAAFEVAEKLNETARVAPVAPRGPDASWSPWTLRYANKKNRYTVARYDAKGFSQLHEVDGQTVYFASFDAAVQAASVLNENSLTK